MIRQQTSTALGLNMKAISPTLESCTGARAKMSLFDHFADIFLTKSTIASERFEILKHQGEVDRMDEGYIER